MTTERQQDNDPFLESVARYLDGNLTEDDTSRLNETLRDDPARRAEFVDYCMQSQLIREYGASCLDDVTVPWPSSGERIDSSSASMGGRKSKRIAIFSAIAAMIMIALFVVPRSTVPMAVASLSRVEGDVFVASLGKTKQQAEANATIRVGDTIVVEATQSRAVLAFTDGTEMQLDGDSSMLIENEKQLRLNAGTLRASVARQDANRPLMLVTHHASVRVLGTMFSVAAAPDRTDVSVDEGRVRLTRAADGASVEVGEGEFAVADKQSELVVRDIPQPPDEWSVDFADGLPADWKRGTFESAGLPIDSQGAVRAARLENDGGVYFQIQSPKRWSDGIFSIHDDTHLHVTFKLERPEWFQVFISTRPFDPDLPPTFLYRFKDDRLWKWSNRGRWLRATIPLTAFERVPERRGTPPLGEVPFELLFSSQGEDRGLVIDRLSVSRGGPGQIVIEELEP